MKPLLAFIQGYKPYRWGAYSVVRLLLEALQRHYTVQTFCPSVKDVERASKFPVIVVADAGAPYHLRHVPVAPNSIVVVVSFACPTSFRMNRLERADLFCTSSLEIAEKYPEKTLYMPPYASAKYFKPVDVPKKYDCVVAGVGRHHTISGRIETVALLREAGLRVFAVGGLWGAHEDNHEFVEGEELLRAFCSAKFSLDITLLKSPVSSRLSQAALCGVPSITRDRLATRHLFEPNKEILLYKDLSTIVDDVVHHVKTADHVALGQRAMERALADHTIECRAGKLIKRIRQMQKDRGEKK